MGGIERIAAERLRQITSEGWTSDHDDRHVENQLARAAVCYALGAERILPSGNGTLLKRLWPWSWQWWKPSGQGTSARIRDLEKAGALIAAEIDRLERDLVRLGMTHGE